MKTTKFSTTISDLKDILADTVDLAFTLSIENRPQHRDVIVTVTAKEEVLNDFIDRNDLYFCISQVVDAD